MYFCSDKSVQSRLPERELNLVQGSLTLGETASLGEGKCLRAIQSEAIINERSRQLWGLTRVSFLEEGSGQCITWDASLFNRKEN